MHEGSIVSGIVKTVLETLERQAIGAIVRKVNVTVGVCQGFVPEAMRAIFDLQKEGTPLAQAELIVELQPMVGLCRACERERELELPIMLCPQCGGPLELIRGRELQVTSIEVDS